MLYARNAAAAAPVAAVARSSAPAARPVPYRPDVDGLRALSVLAVILFHAHAPGFAGGYVGVDVFFVISGCLITQVLTAPRERGLSRRLRDFYVRRCRRLLPALIVMLVAVAPLAYWLFLPVDLAKFGRQLAATAVFMGNLVTLHDTGYFDQQTPLDPLAHLWSIAVEEQFYLVFPLLLLASGGPRTRRILVCGAALASFALCVWGSYRHPIANFFLAPTRAWELLLGALVALGVGRSLADRRHVADALATAALVALAGCVFWYNRSTPYPGLYALIPCASAAILLVTGGGAASHVARWLSARPLVFTGLISYSLYLWHLPVLALARYYHIEPLEPRELAVLFCSIYLLAAISWRYVEAPIRGRTVLRGDALFLPFVATSTFAIAMLGGVLWGSGGLPGRLDDADAKLTAPDDRYFEDAHDCVRSPPEVAAGSLCSFGPARGGKHDVLVWGDSHAIVLFPAYERIATARDVRVRAAVRPACSPLLAVSRPFYDAAQRQRCADFNRAVVEAIDTIDPALVILNAYWLYPDLRLETNGEGGSAPASFDAAFERTLHALGAERRKVCVVGDVPRLDYDLPNAYLFVARKRGLDPAFLAPSRADALLRLRELDDHFARLRGRHAFTFVDPAAALCAGSRCALITDEGRPLYRDDNHLATAGALFLTGSLEACFDGIP